MKTTTVTVNPFPVIALDKTRPYHGTTQVYQCESWEEMEDVLNVWRYVDYRLRICTTIEGLYTLLVATEQIDWPYYRSNHRYRPLTYTGLRQEVVRAERHFAKAS